MWTYKTGKSSCEDGIDIWEFIFQLGDYFPLTKGISEFLATDPEVWVRFPALPDFLRDRGSGTGSTQPREYN
jgi:hypothetical protein